MGSTFDGIAGTCTVVDRTGRDSAGGRVHVTAICSGGVRDHKTMGCT